MDKMQVIINTLQPEGDSSLWQRRTGGSSAGEPVYADDLEVRTRIGLEQEKE